jgi:hypothetical protein
MTERTTEELISTIRTIISKAQTPEEYIAEIRILLVSHLVACAKKNPEFNRHDMAIFLELISGVFDILIADDDEIIIHVQEQLLSEGKLSNEEKLLNEGIIVNAECARKLTESFREEYDDLYFSGLERQKLDVMTSIKKSILEGNDNVVCNVYGDSPVIAWLQKLGYHVEPWKHIHSKISW